ncbi:helix-turn-helix domain-containing protein [Microbacterium sp. CJ88]|uniref:helix-turn-helix domain-containing protein n=1 Tax=Microbacterium sp. CJ88 TaxID=3445672 RepID=UPI003F6609F9
MTKVEHGRYKVVVTKVEVAECWVRAESEDAALEQVREEMRRPFAYVGRWETKASEVVVVEATAILPRPNTFAESGPALLGLRAAAEALGVSYSTIYQMTRRDEIEFTWVGSRKYISRDALASFVKGGA